MTTRLLDAVRNEAVATQPETRQRERGPRQVSAETLASKIITRVEVDTRVEIEALVRDGVGHTWSRRSVDGLVFERGSAVLAHREQRAALHARARECLGGRHLTRSVRHVGIVGIREPSASAKPLHDARVDALEQRGELGSRRPGRRLETQLPPRHLRSTRRRDRDDGFVTWVVGVPLAKSLSMCIAFSAAPSILCPWVFAPCSPQRCSSPAGSALSATRRARRRVPLRRASLRPRPRRGTRGRPGRPLPRGLVSGQASRRRAPGCRFTGAPAR